MTSNGDIIVPVKLRGGRIRLQVHHRRARCPACESLEHFHQQTKNNRDGTLTWRRVCGECGEKFDLILT